MKNIPLISIVIISILSINILIYSEQANAQEKNENKEQETILIKNKDLNFIDLKQNPDTIKAMTIVDGRTFVGYNGKTYSLSSLDIQLNSGNHSLKGKELLEELIKDQTLILFQTKNQKIGRQNRMGHIMVHVIKETDKTWIQASLIANGVARVRTTPFNYEQATALLSIESKARAGKVGLWSDEEYQILTPENASDNIGEFNIVEGTVKKVASTKNNVYLNFGDNWKDDFTIGIEPKVRKELSKKNVSPLSWEHKKIRIHGWIRFYNGPYIDLTHAEQIELIDESDDEQEQSIPAN